MTPENIVFFDGVCNLCNGTVNFIVRHDKNDVFRFASLQSATAQKLLRDKYPRSGRFDTVYYLEEGVLYEQSAAVLRIMKKLGLPISILYGLIIIPPFIRNYLYGLISRNRYKWFGKRETCMIPSPEMRRKFL